MDRAWLRRRPRSAAASSSTCRAPASRRAGQAPGAASRGRGVSRGVRLPRPWWLACQARSSWRSGSCVVAKATPRSGPSSLQDAVSQAPDNRSPGLKHSTSVETPGIETRALSALARAPRARTTSRRLPRRPSSRRAASHAEDEGADQDSGRLGARGCAFVEAASKSSGSTRRRFPRRLADGGGQGSASPGSRRPPGSAIVRTGIAEALGAPNEEASSLSPGRQDQGDGSP